MVLTITIFIVSIKRQSLSFLTIIYLLSIKRQSLSQHRRSNDSRYHFLQSLYFIDDQSSVAINVTLNLLVVVETTTLDLIN